MVFKWKARWSSIYEHNLLSWVDNLVKILSGLIEIDFCLLNIVNTNQILDTRVLEVFKPLTHAISTSPGKFLVSECCALSLSLKYIKRKWKWPASLVNFVSWGYLGEFGIGLGVIIYFHCYKWHICFSICLIPCQVFYTLLLIASLSST